MEAAAARKYSRFGPYLLLDRIAVGGMAEVFRGRQAGVEGFAKMVAIKRILPEIAADEDFVEMFITEAKLTNQMQHANVVQIYDLGQVEASYYIAMEYISGVDLRLVWDGARRRKRRLPTPMSCYVVQRICEGLDYAHRKKDELGRELGLVHRDVSPQNVLVSFEGEIKVADFGIAKAKHKVSKTQAGFLKGKFGYMSPEQVRGIELDGRSDIFAAGVLLWELLVGQRLFLGESDFDTLERVRQCNFAPPSAYDKAIAAELEAIVLKALSKERDQRYKHASDMAEDLQRYLFKAEQAFSRPDLQHYMKQHFAAEMAEEAARLEAYAAIEVEPLRPPPTPAPTGLAILPLPSAGPAAPSMPLRPSNQPPYPHHSQPGILVPLGTPPPSILNGSISTPLIAPPLNSVSVSGVDPSSISYPGSFPGGTQPGVLSQTVEFKLPPWVKVALAGMGALILLTLGLVGYLVLHGSRREPGSLIVEVRPPDAEILLNDRLVANRAPLNLDGLEPVMYVIQVRKPGYKPVIRPLKLGEGEAHSESIVLEPQPAQTPEN